MFYETSTDTLYFQGSTSLSNYEILLRSVSYRNTDEDPDSSSSRIIFYTCTDNLGGETTSVATVDVIPVNDAPVIDTNDETSGFNNEVTFTESFGPILIAENSNVTDVDNVNLIECRLILSPIPDGSAEVLSTSVALPGGITGVYQGGSYQLSGVASLQTYEDVLYSVTYENTDNGLSTVQRRVRVTCRDESGDANTETSIERTIIINVVPYNDPPVVDLDSTTGSNDYSLIFVEGSAAVDIVNNPIPVTDVDSRLLSYCSVRILYTYDELTEYLQSSINGCCIHEFE